MARFYLFLKLHFFTFVYFLEHYCIFGCFGEQKLCENYIFLIQTSIWQKSNRGIVLRRKQLKLLRLLIICKKIELKCLLKTDIMQFTPKKYSTFRMDFFCLVICSTGDDLLAGRPEQDGVLELGSVAAFDVTQWRVRLDDSLLGEILQRHLEKLTKIKFVLKRNGHLKLHSNTFTNYTAPSGKINKDSICVLLNRLSFYTFNILICWSDHIFHRLLWFT